LRIEKATVDLKSSAMTSAVIVAAGRGTRMGPDVDKLFLPVAGKPLAAHTWLRFDRVAPIDEIILVVRHEMESAFKNMAAELRLKKPWRTVVGGAERQDSVWNGLQAIAAKTEVVAIQDAARPCTPESLIRETILAAKQFGAAVAAKKVTDTIGI